MSGAKQFDPDQALDRAMRAFWTQGFEGTSYAALTRATRLNKSSLYNAFGDKRQLYKRCLERFAAQFGERLRARLDAPTLAAAIDEFFDELTARFATDDVPEGCMLTMAALEIGSDNALLSDGIKAQMIGLERRFEERCDRAVADGELPENTDTAALASFFLAVTRGLAVLHRGYGDVAAVRRAVRTMRGILDCPPVRV